MRLLLTSDWQTDVANIDLCQISLKELKAAAKKHKPDAIILAGDLKDQYSPVHIQVVQFWVRAIRELRALEIPVSVLLGNHDRVSQSVESDNWLDILRAAGASAVASPRWKNIGDGSVAFLPFTKDTKQLIAWAEMLSGEASKKTSALIFHNEVSGGDLGTGVPTHGVTPEELRFDRYVVAAGGHVHYHQKISRNGWFIGSPFCQDWGEANASKGHILLDVVGGKVTVRQIKTTIPGWYDTEYLEEHGIEPENGAYIRSRVPVHSKKITEQLREEEERMQRAYPAISGLRFFVVPKIIPTDGEAVALVGTTDADKVASYVAATWPETAQYNVHQAVNYLTSKLEELPEVAPGKQIRFLSCAGENVLSFERVKIKYAKQGLILLQGKNTDWPKHSNGAGKTNVLGLLSVVGWGTTLKGQRNDAWAREETEDRAVGVLRLRDARRRLIEIERSRRPHSLYLRVDGKDASSGLRSSGRQETQGLIEDLLGYDLQMLRNAVYIDQSIANGFVFGSKQGRLDLLNKLQNLERYEAALKLVQRDLERAIAVRLVSLGDLERHEEHVAEYEDALADLKQRESTDWEQKRKAAEKEKVRLITLRSGYKASKKLYAEMQQEIDDTDADRGVTVNRLEELVAKERSLRARIRDAEALVKAGRCPRCEQKAEGIGVKLRDTAKDELASVVESIQVQRKDVVRMTDTIADKQKKIRQYEHAVERTTLELEAANTILCQVQSAAEEEEKRNSVLRKKREGVTEALRKAKRLLRATRDHLKQIDAEQELCEYAKEAFHRSGIPMYLSAALCPMLNSAADEFSDLFCGGRLRLHFEVRDGDFHVEPVNPAGSNTLDGQSVGEAALAGLIAAFALREASPKTNLLILDEPGSGLDEQAAKRFAQGLVKLKDRYETIIVTSHHPAITSVLAGEQVWTVVKENGVSVLHC